jgi:6-pyruvoyltetrahydropterin/6-carboxytetrahydropterin synthase
MIPFAPLKAALSDICAAWKERVLLAEQNPYFEIVRDDGTEIELRLCGQRYVLPRADVLLLPIDNISVEALAAHVASLLQSLPLLAAPHVRTLEVTVEESPGQGASCAIALH